MSAKTTAVVEEYLQLIYRLRLEGDVKSIQLANHLNTSPSTVHATLSRMQRDGLIKLGSKKQIYFTEQGEQEATNMVLRHNLAETFLCNVLGIPWYEVHEHAHQLEHAMTPLVTEKLAEFLGKPEFCPHGTPIPGHGSSLPEGCFPLAEAEQGSQIEVVMIDEFLEDSPELLKYLHEKSITPKQQHQVLERLDALHSLTLKQGDSIATLPYDVAGRIIVITKAP